MLRKLRTATAIRIQKVVRAKIARAVLQRLQEREAHRRFVHALTKLQARVQAWKARAVVQLLREEQQWHECVRAFVCWCACVRCVQACLFHLVLSSTS